MDKIKMTTPIVEMDGDEMTRVLWQKIKDILIYPYIDLKSEYYDLGLENRNKTDDQVTIDSAEATKKYGVAVKCATITPNAARMDEYNLKQMWKSPNGTIRAILDGTVFRSPILVKGITPYIPTWKKPICIARHAYGDVYKNTEMVVKAGSKAELCVTKPDGTEERSTIFDFKTDGIIQGMHRVFLHLPVHVLTMHSTKSSMYGLPQRIQSARSMTIDSKIFLPKFLKTSTKRNLSRQALHISTHLLMTPLQELSEVRAAICGLAKTMTAM